MTYRYIYKITCTQGSFKDKFYYGQHTTDNLDDNYFASGRKINDYKKKYGKESCIREIIAFYNTEEELNKAEYEIIHPWLGNEMCLNIGEGGYYGKPSLEARRKISEKKRNRKNPKNSENMKKLWQDQEYRATHYHFEKGNIPWNKNLPKEFQPGYGKPGPMTGKQSPNKGREWDEDFKQNVSLGVSKYYVEHPEAGQNLSEKFKKLRWVTKDNEPPQRIHVDELEDYLSRGYRRGRK